VSEKLKIKDKGHMGTYFNQISRKEFKKCGISNSPGGSKHNIIWYSDDDHMSSAADNNDGESNGE
jgi:hypothetical protein